MTQSATIECRNESYVITEKAKRRRYIQYVMSINGRPMTALEIAMGLYQLGKVNRIDRNYVSPRLTEMCDEGVLEPVGKKICNETGRKVTAFQIRKAM